MESSLRLLVVTGSSRTVEQINHALQQDGLFYSVQYSDSDDRLRAALIDHNFDAVVADDGMSLPEAKVLLGIVRAADQHLPFLVVSDRADDEYAVALMREGANDYISSSHIDRLAPALRWEVGESRKRRARWLTQLQSQHLAAIITDAAVAVISTTLDDVITTWNPGAERLYGYASGEILGHEASLLLPPAEAETMRAWRARTSGGESRPASDVVRLHRSGTFLDVSESLAPIRDTEGRIRGVSLIGIDISERKRAEKSDKESEAHLRAFVDQNPATLFVKDKDGRLLYVNHIWPHNNDRQPIKWVGKASADISAPETALFLRSNDEDCLIADTVLEREETARTSNGEERTLLVTRFPVVDAGERRVGGMAWDITDRKLAELSLRRCDLAIHAATQGIVITDSNQFDNPIIYANGGFERLTGYAWDEIVGRNCRFLQGKATDPAAVAALRAAVRGGRTLTVDLLNYRRDGTPYWSEVSISPVKDSEGRITHYIGIQTDVTSKRDQDEQARQLQKMEAVGQLASGVAHDFNSLLTIIGGCCDLVLQNLQPDHPSRELIADIHRTGERSARLTRQLLAFSRRQTLQSHYLDLNTVVTDMEKILRRLIGDAIDLTITLDPNPWTLWVDPGELEQVLMNLVVNAADAMPAGGKLIIATRNVLLDEAYVRSHSDARAGPHVLLSVTDSGLGMTPEVKARLFEPFFTTKQPGQATGLGLPTAYGIVRQSGGHITVHSQVGSGSTFNVYLPRAERTNGGTMPDSATVAAPTGTETILLAEDDDGVRALSYSFLTGCGYKVLAATNGDNALRLGQNHDGPIHLLITDVVMPGRGGRDVAEHLAARFTDLRVLFISGYADEMVTRHGVLREKVHFLQKPFTLIALATKVREILDVPVEPGH